MSPHNAVCWCIMETSPIWVIALQNGCPAPTLQSSVTFITHPSQLTPCCAQPSALFQYKNTNSREIISFFFLARITAFRVKNWLQQFKLMIVCFHFLIYLLVFFPQVPSFLLCTIVLFIVYFFLPIILSQHFPFLFNLFFLLPCFKANILTVLIKGHWPEECTIFLSTAADWSNEYFNAPCFRYIFVFFIL